MGGAECGQALKGHCLGWEALREAWTGWGNHPRASQLRMNRSLPSRRMSDESEREKGREEGRERGSVWGGVPKDCWFIWLRLRARLHSSSRRASSAVIHGPWEELARRPTCIDRWAGVIGRWPECLPAGFWCGEWTPYASLSPPQPPHTSPSRRCLWRPVLVPCRWETSGALGLLPPPGMFRPKPPTSSRSNGQIPPVVARGTALGSPRVPRISLMMIKGGNCLVPT